MHLSGADDARSGHEFAIALACEASRARFEQMGVRLTQVYWTLGEHDIIAVAEADDEETMAAATLTLVSQGNLRTTTMRALSPDEMRAVIAKTG